MTARATLWATVTALAACAPSAAGDGGLFGKRVAPILEERCVVCHSGKAPKGGLSLTTAGGLRAGGENGPVVVAGKPGQSLLIRMVSGPAAKMPRKGSKLTAGEVAILRKWIEEGAQWPRGITLAARKTEETWWSLRPLERPRVPDVKAAGWVRTPVDAFVLSR